MYKALVLLLVVACGGAQHGAGRGDDRCWPVEAFRLEALEHGSEWEPVLIVSADGTVRRPGSDAIRGRLSRKGERDVFTVVEGSGGVLTCGPDHVIDFQGKRTAYGADDSLEDHGMRIEIDAHGEVHMGAQAADQRARIVGDLTHVRRTAVLLVLASLGL